jgi:hypothetical protein
MGRRRARPSPSKHLDFKVMLATDPGTGDAGYAKACLAFFLPFQIPQSVGASGSSIHDLQFAFCNSLYCHLPQRRIRKSAEHALESALCARRSAEAGRNCACHQLE